MTQGKQITLRLSNMQPEKAAKRTREVVDEGGSATWIWTRDRYFVRASAALDGWEAPHGTRPARMGHGQSMAYYAATSEGNPRATIGELPSNPSTAQSWSRRCQVCGWTDTAWAWDRRDDAIAKEQVGTFQCRQCVSRVHGWARKRR